MLIPPPIERSEPSTPQDVALSALSGLAGNECADQNPNMEKDRRLQRLSGFLFSLILHLVVLVALALIFQRVVPPKPLLITLASADSESVWSSTDELDSIPSVELASAEIEDTAFADEAVPVELEDVAEMTLETLFPTNSNAQTDPVPPTEPASSNHPSNENEKRNKKIEFFGAQAYGNSFVFVLDISASMAARNGQRLQRATMELIRSINQLNAQQNFSVVLYSDRAMPMFLAGNEPEMRQATPKNKQAAITWLKYWARPVGGTFPASALQIAGKLKPDAVFFLSDGEFLYGQVPGFGVELNSFLRGFGQARFAAPPTTDGPSDPQSVLSAYDPKIVVHTIAFESISSRPLMEQIAREKSGQHRFIPAP